MSEKLIREIHEKVVETNTMMQVLVKNDADKEDRLRSLEGSRNKFYGFLGVGLFASFLSNLENMSEAIKRTFH
jgi:hypothetical protein